MISPSADYHGSIYTLQAAKREELKPVSPPFMKHLILTLCSLLAISAVHAAESQVPDAAGRWPAAKANQWYDSQPWPCGFNYIPAHAISYTEMWMPYKK